MYGEDNLPKIIEFTKLNGSPVKIIMPEKKARKIVDYILLSYTEISLSEIVNNWIKKDYQPYGNPFYTNACPNGSYDPSICQAMVKYED